MGKKQHQSDKMYLTATEWATFYGGKKAKAPDKAKFRRLPFSCCSLSLQPFEHPLCTKEGVIFDLMNIVPFLKKYGVSPVTGKPMSAKELVKLHFHKNSQDKYHCPVTFKQFNENTHIVAIKTTGNVFAYDAVDRLNYKTKNFRDLLTDEAFTKADVITIQDPTNLDKFNLANFYHVKNNLKVPDEEEEDLKSSKRNLKSINRETMDILDELDREYKPQEKQSETKKRADKFNAAHFSTGAVAASFTSTAVNPETQHESAIIDEDVVRYKYVKKKAYVRIITNKGMLNVELHSDMVPKTCENFLKLCQKGYYNGTIFHRSIRNFMIQGGDPTGTGTGGESIWESPFKDEFKPNLTHTGRGVLSMANSGPNTNKSQFFITYRSCRHLDQKHTVFGKVVGGLETIDKMEAVPCDKKDKPEKELRIEACQVFVDPYTEADEQLAKDRAGQVEKERLEAVAAKQPAAKKQDNKLKTFKQGVGKYINPAIKAPSLELGDEPSKKKKKTMASGFGNFSNW
ncbi:unnamed protein product [Owenia fusiformis]|uniref:RING-type E3 ubiquitin-protein ligase PPIL2 n=1 Tax=Owenia fusiformis TaxID=6347 RepID=A0A8J1TNG2_OWEFU|nr:unnamed protein product [Owenia fusiformis]